MINKEEIVKYYDSAEPDYKFVLGLSKNLAMHYGFWKPGVHSLSEALNLENEVLAKRAKIDKSSYVLDAGCGVGGTAIYLAKKYDCKATGITLSQNQVDSATKNAEKQKLSARVNFLQEDYLKTGFKDKTFDVAIAIESVCHAEDKNKFVKEAYRILKNGGRLVIADGFYSRTNYDLNDLKLMDKWLSGWGVNFLETEENFKRYLKDTGFKDISFTECTKDIFPTARGLYLWSFLGLTFGQVIEWLGFRNKIQRKNVLAARYQYLTLKKQLWKYGYFYAEK